MSASGNFYDGVDFRYLPSGGASAPPVQVARDGRLGPRLINTDYNNFAPRFGIAYSPSDKWSIRTGFGVFYSQESKNSIFDLNRGLGGRTSVLPDTTKAPTTNYTNFINASSLPVNIATGLTWGASPNLPTTYYHAVRSQRAAFAGEVHDAGGGLQRLAEPQGGQPDQRKRAHSGNHGIRHARAVSGIRAESNT